MPDSAPLPTPLTTGFRSAYRWLSTTQHGIDEVTSRCPAVVLGKYLAVTSCDSGPLELRAAEKSAGWETRGGVAYSPRVDAIEMLPVHNGWDEWYIFRDPFDQGAIRQANIFEHPVTPGNVEVFVNFGGFSLGAAEAEDLTSRFWQQLEWILPDAYIAESDHGCLTFATRDSDLFASVRQVLGG
jgi:hypothetical protein